MHCPCSREAEKESATFNPHLQDRVDLEKMGKSDGMVLATNAPSPFPLACETQ